MKLVALLLFSVHLNAATIENFAGSGKAGYDPQERGPLETPLNQPFGITVNRGSVFFCDTNNHVIRVVNSESGDISTFVGCGIKAYSGDGGAPGRAALNEPYELRFTPNNDLYWVERLNHVVRKLDAKTNLVSTIAGTGQPGFSGDGGPATAAMLNQPHSIEFDQKFENLLICDIVNNRIRAVSLATGKISTWCGNGTKAQTPDFAATINDQIPLKGPRALAIAPNGDLWLALREGNAIYRIDAKAKTLERIAGTGKQGFTGNGGPAKDATLSGPKGLAVSPDGKFVYFADTESHSIRAIDLSKNPPTIELIAGDGRKGSGPDSPDPSKCQLARPHGVAVSPSGELYIGDSENHKVRLVSFTR